MQRPKKESTNNFQSNFSIICNLFKRRTNKKLSPDPYPETKFQDFPLGHDFINSKLENWKSSFDVTRGLPVFPSNSEKKFFSSQKSPSNP